MKKKIVIIIVAILFVTVILSVADKLTNNKISNFFSISYLYLTSTREVTFEQMIIKSPYNYIKTVDQDSLVLLKYPKNDITIIFKKMELLTPDVFFNSYTYRLEKLKFSSINRAKKIINQKQFYILTGSKKPKMPDYKEYVYIPSRQVIIEYLGIEKGGMEFWKILQSIKFI